MPDIKSDTKPIENDPNINHVAFKEIGKNTRNFFSSRQRKGPFVANSNND
jgi:hypothetical protein